MGNGGKILIVDDDDAVRAAFKRALAKSGYSVCESIDGLDALTQVANEHPALIVLDVDMPRLNGWKTLEELRRRGWTQPILMVTHVNDVEARVRGLEQGADDYIGKPCDASELLARVAALLRRGGGTAGQSRRLLQFGDIVVDLERRTVTGGRTPLRLTRTEFALLELLREHAGRPVSREQLIARVWNGNDGYSHALDTHLWRLRKKLGDTGDGPRWICNLPGIGFMMVPDVVKVEQL